jgi:hypothetical protein
VYRRPGPDEILPTASNIGAIQHLTCHQCKHHIDSAHSRFLCGGTIFCLCASMEYLFGVAPAPQNMGLPLLNTTPRWILCGNCLLCKCTHAILSMCLGAVGRAKVGRAGINFNIATGPHSIKYLAVQVLSNYAIRVSSDANATMKAHTACCTAAP